MSGKRFWFVIDKGKLDYVQDNISKARITVSELEDLLNEQQAMIRELKEENDILEQKLQTRYIVNKQYEELQRLKKENEQLRHEIEIEKKWQLAQDRYYVKIKEENEQLRKELDNFKPIMFKNMQKGTIILYSKGDNDE